MKFSLAKVAFKNSAIEGRGVFARTRFDPGDVIVAYAPKQLRIDVSDPEAQAIGETKVSLLSDEGIVIIPDTSVPGGWLCNHSCYPNASIFSSGEGCVKCIRTIVPGKEVTVFYGWVTRNEPGRDPCHCGAAGCRGFINFDISDEEAREAEADTPEGERFGKKVADYFEFLREIGQEHAKENVLHTLARMRERLSGHDPG